jgi:hypothetical protein
LSYSTKHNCCLRPVHWLLLAVLALLPVVVPAADFKISNLACRSADNAFVLDAAVDYDFSDKVIEALQNGVPITLEMHLQVRRKGAWVWEKDLLDRRIRYQIRYHALASVYQVMDLQNSAQQSFVTREVAISSLGDVHGLPVILHSKLEKGKIYNIEMRATLDVDSLPLPLRPMAYLSPDWNLSSKWHSCRIRR